MDQQSQTLLKDRVGGKRAIRKTFESLTAPKQWGQKASCSGLRSGWEVRKWCLSISIDDSLDRSVSKRKERDETVV